MQNAETCGFDVASIAGTEMGYNAQDSRGFMESSQDEDIILWMEEILHHLGWLKPYEEWDVAYRFQLGIWISSINHLL